MLLLLSTAVTGKGSAATQFCLAVKRYSGGQRFLSGQLRHFTQNPLQAFGKASGGSDKADDQKTITGKIVEMPGMHEDAAIAQQGDGEFFIRACGRNSHDSIPAGFNFQAAAERLLC